MKAHYPGDCTDIDSVRGRTGLPPGGRTVYGPDLHGALYQAVSADYDAAKDQTTITFKPFVRPR